MRLEAYLDLQKYGEYLKEFQRLDLDILLEETEKAEDRVYSAELGAGADAKDLLMIRAIDRYVALLDTAYRIQMSSKDFEFFRASEPDFATVDCLWSRAATESGTWR